MSAPLSLDEARAKLRYAVDALHMNPEDTDLCNQVILAQHLLAEAQRARKHGPIGVSFYCLEAQWNKVFEALDAAGITYEVDGPWERPFNCIHWDGSDCRHYFPHRTCDECTDCSDYEEPHGFKGVSP